MHPLTRLVVPEILDSLPASDPRARRSRRDLLWVDAYMGNSRWILRKIPSLPNAGGAIVELGAGEGRLAMRIGEAFPTREILALDLAERPKNLTERVTWVRGDFFETLRTARGDICAGSLILHHFSESALKELGGSLRNFRALIFSEPLRSRLALRLAGLATPLASEVTRHDMPASIRAGFLPGELPCGLGLDPTQWTWHESSTLRGALRLVACRRE
jgi:hypothetical protein